MSMTPMRVTTGAPSGAAPAPSRRVRNRPSELKVPLFDAHVPRGTGIVALIPVDRSSTCTGQFTQIGPQAISSGLVAITSLKVPVTRRVFGSQSLYVTVPGASYLGASRRSAPTARWIQYPAGRRNLGPTGRPAVVTSCARADIAPMSSVLRWKVSIHTAPLRYAALTPYPGPMRVAVGEPSAMK